jgi:hypothetical protein
MIQLKHKIFAFQFYLWYKVICSFIKFKDLLMYRYIYIISLTVLPLFLEAQKCFPYNGLIQTQQQVNSFKANYPNCTEIEGSLNIANLVENLDSLLHLESISGSLIIFNSRLKNLDGISQVSMNGGNLVIINNSLLCDISGFNEVSSLGRISITGNNQLTNITGFDQLNQMTSYIEIKNNDELEHISGFDKLENCSNLEISELPNLEKLHAFNGLKHVSNDFTIRNNPKLHDMITGSELISIGSFLRIRNNPSLNELKGFEKLETCGVIQFIGNRGITELNHFNSLLEGDVYVSGLNQLLHVKGFENLKKSNLISFDSNSNLKSISGFNNIERVDSIIWIHLHWDSLEVISGFENLMEVPILSIAGARGVKDFSAFKNLEKVNNLRLNSLFTDDQDLETLSNLKYVDTLSIGLFYSLNTDLQGLRNIDYTQIKNLRITGMWRDIVCHVEPICRYLDEEIGPYFINNNLKEGCRTKEEILGLCTLSATEESVQKGILLYPNPTTGKFAIETEADFDIKIFDQAGREVAYNRYNDIISLRDNVPGVYFVEVRTAGRIYTQQLLVVR